MEHFDNFYNKQEESAKKDNKEEKGSPSNVVLTHKKVKDLILILFFPGKQIFARENNKIN